MFINHSAKQVTAKIVYYGPGLSGKTTNLQYIFSVTNPKTRGELVSIETDVERTLFFDLLPINVGLINGYQTRFQLYTVPGQVFYDSTRQLVLKGADGIVFVADSQELMEKANRESFENLTSNLSKHNQKVEDLPVVFQFNKRDLKNTSPIELLNKQLNKLEAPYFGAVATIGTGVIETLREISSLTLKKIKSSLDQSNRPEIISTIVNFDTDKKHEIIKREELPLKKVSVKTAEDLQNKILSGEEKEKQINGSEEIIELTEFEQIKESSKEEEPKEAPEFKALEETQIEIEVEELKGFDDIDEPAEEEKPAVAEAPERKELEETQVEIEVEGLKGFENIEEPPEEEKKPEEVPEFEALDEPQIEIEVEELKGFDDIEEIQLLEESEESIEPVEVEKVEEVKEIEEAAEVKEVEETKQPPKMAETGPEVELEKIEALRKAPQKPEPPKASKPSKSTAVDFLEKLKDPTRLTVIKEIKELPKQGVPIVIEVKDKKKASSLLDPIELKIEPGIKKITLILDLKK